MDVGAERTRLFNALLAQGYARVAVEHLTTAGDIDLTDPNVPGQLTQLLQDATNSTDWKRIGERFALLKGMPNGTFDNLFLRADGQRLHLVVVGRFGGGPPVDATIRFAFDYSWPVLQNVDDLLEKFKLPAPVQEAANQIVSGYITATDPATTAAVSLLKAVIAANVVNAGPSCGFVAICEGGVSAEVVQKVDAWEYFAKKVELSLANPPYLAGILWDVPGNAIHGKDMYGGGTISPTQLRQSLGAS